MSVMVDNVPSFKIYHAVNRLQSFLSSSHVLGHLGHTGRSPRLCMYLQCLWVIQIWVIQVIWSTFQHMIQTKEWTDELTTLIMNSKRMPHHQTSLTDRSAIGIWTVHHGSMAPHLALVAVVLTAQGRGAVAAQTQRAAPVAVVQTAVVALTTGTVRTSLLSLFCHPQLLQKCYLQ